MMQEEQLFGVSHGQVTGLSVYWCQQPDATGQAAHIEVTWQNRRPSKILVLIPDDQQIGGYITRCMDLVMNGSWMHKNRVAHALHKLVEDWSRMGGEVKISGSKLPRG